MKARNVLLVTGAIAAVSIVGILAVNQHKPVPAPQAASKPDITGLWQDVNNERIKAGEKPLVLDEKLNTSAAAKCADETSKNYFEHNTPDGRTPETFIRASEGTAYKLWGENIAYGFNSDQKTVDAWMRSPEHRANILKADYTNVGYAVCSPKSYQNLVVQHFTQI